MAVLFFLYNDTLRKFLYEIPFFLSNNKLQMLPVIKRFLFAFTSYPFSIFKATIAINSGYNILHITCQRLSLLPAIMVTKFRSRRFLIGLISYHLEQLSYIHLKFCHAARHLSVARSLVFDQIILNAPFVQSYLFVTYLSHHPHRI